MTTTPRAVAFDLGGVLVDVDHARGARVLGCSLEEWERALFTSDAHERVSRGEAPPEALFDPAARALSRAAADVRNAWAQVVSVWEGAPALVRAVDARGVRVLVWSNTDPVHADEMARALPVIGAARGLSFRVGAMKPSPSFYERALEPGLSFHEVLFLDDRSDNVEAAARLGVHAVQIQGGLEGTRAALHAAFGDREPPPADARPDE